MSIIILHRSTFLLPHLIPRPNSVSRRRRVPILCRGTDLDRLSDHLILKVCQEGNLGPFTIGSDSTDENKILLSLGTSVSLYGWTLVPWGKIRNETHGTWDLKERVYGIGKVSDTPDEKFSVVMSTIDVRIGLFQVFRWETSEGPTSTLQVYVYSHVPPVQRPDSSSILVFSPFDTQPSHLRR